MKINKAKPIITPEVRADQLGRQYVDAQEIIKVEQAKADAANTEIKELAEKHGTKTGKETIIAGSNFVVGFLETEASKTVSYELAKKHLPPQVFVRCTMETLDPKKVEALVDAGVISAAQLLKIVTVARAGSKRLIVKKV